MLCVEEKSHYPAESTLCYSITITDEHPLRAISLSNAVPVIGTPFCGHPPQPTAARTGDQRQAAPEQL